eukprot:scaffold352971_cov51-Prasinocladus_malaysianus.AAC.1
MVLIEACYCAGPLVASTGRRGACGLIKAAAESRVISQSAVSTGHATDSIRAPCFTPFEDDGDRPGRVLESDFKQELRKAARREVDNFDAIEELVDGEKRYWLVASVPQ